MQQHELGAATPAQPEQQLVRLPLNAPSAQEKNKLATWFDVSRWPIQRENKPYRPAMLSHRGGVCCVVNSALVDVRAECRRRHNSSHVIYSGMLKHWFAHGAAVAR